VVDHVGTSDKMGEKNVEELLNQRMGWDIATLN
jgi:hypothetical protein